MAPAAIRLQRLLHMPRLQAPQSPHDVAFKQRFYNKMLAAVALLQSPDDASLSSPERLTSLLKSLTHSVGHFIK